jgi:hypothetical protein
MHTWEDVIIFLQVDLWNYMDSDESWYWRSTLKIEQIYF